MWKVLLVALPLVLGSCRASGPLEQVVEQSTHTGDQETMNTEEQRFKYLLYQISDTMKKLLSEQKKYIDNRFNTLTLSMETICGAQAISQVSGRTDVAETGIDIENMAAEIVRILTAVLQSQLSSLATSEDLSDLQSNLSSFASTLTGEVKQEISSLASEMDTSTKGLATESQLQEIKEQLESVTSCNHREDFDKVLALLTTTEEDIDDLAESLNTSLAEQKAACLGGDEHQERTASLVQLLESLQVTVNSNANSIRDVASVVGGLEGKVVQRLETLEELAEKINNNTLLPPPPPPPTTTTTTPRPTTTTTAARQISPCLDSTFVGGGATLDVCNAAVHYRKCQLDFVAYHCCRSCTEAGMVPEIGPHRYLSFDRRVSILKALQIMRP
ncbi:nucleoprotein TPR-like [Penaeus chinensis]|uniref:nucleoprotein TPR-like n=1 Tax=Penaeus chinensis TaxID=139456 RepID=UPI001FB6A396|nr:nucleoprotein TPR-like [Penaeus chinensis]